MRPLSLIIIFALTIFSCDYLTQKKQNKKNTSTIDNKGIQGSKKTDSLEERLNRIPKNIKPVFGYRFIISGDFDGDGKKEQLIEHFLSGLDNKETNKFYDGLNDYEQLVYLTIKKEPISFVISDNELIDTLHISSFGQLLGLSYLKNEGDLNGDGTDEVSYVVNWADWSNINTWHLVTYKNKRWRELYSFRIRDFQIPDLPETFNRYGLWGLENKIINTTNDSINERIENDLRNFEGLVKKLKKNKIQVIFVNEEADDDTMIVDLNIDIQKAAQ